MSVGMFVNEGGDKKIIVVKYGSDAKVVTSGFGTNGVATINHTGGGTQTAGNKDAMFVLLEKNGKPGVELWDQRAPALRLRRRRRRVLRRGSIQGRQVHRRSGLHEPAHEQPCRWQRLHRRPSGRRMTKSGTHHV
jgi:hypothetical protein